MGFVQVWIFLLLGHYLAYTPQLKSAVPRRAKLTLKEVEQKNKSRITHGNIPTYTAMGKKQVHSDSANTLKIKVV